MIRMGRTGAMRKLFCFLLLAGCTIANSNAQGNEWDHARDTETLVRQAIAFLRINGKQKTLAEVNRPRGQFVDRGRHVVVFDLSGLVLADASDNKRVGQNMIASADAQGQHFVQRYITVGMEGGGWVMYHWPTPDNARLTYVEKVGDLLITCTPDK
jgi:cytochrome c